MTRNNNGQRFSTTAESDGKPSPPRTGFDPPPLLPSQLIQISVWQLHFNYWHLSSLIAKVTFGILHQKSQDTSSSIWNQPWQKKTLSDLFKDSFLCWWPNKLWNRKQGPEVTYSSAPTQDTIPLKQDKFQQEMSQWKNHYSVWTAGLPVISLYIIGSLLFFKSKSSFIFLFSAGRQNQSCLKSFFYKITNIVQIL